MSKIAQLPNGQFLEFPDDMPDEDMDNQVRQALGLPLPVDPVEEQHAFLSAVNSLGQVSQALQQLAIATQSNAAEQMRYAGEQSKQTAMIANALSSLATALGEVMNQQNAVLAKLTEVSYSVVASNDRVAAANKELAVVQAAPKMFIMDDANKPIGLAPNLGKGRK